ncbi:helix-turn-helix domain-containing protein [Streptomyces sp. NPDC056944]|uniref:helix-turn-helix domain-containing protein n=1 Tax=Streptomyces sp. NPDC056944 TaxID=3345972 RepID=UPI003626FC38
MDPSQGLEQYIGRMVQDARLALVLEAKREGKTKQEPWTQAFVATRTYTSQSRISEVETGEVPPDTDLARKLETTLGLPHDALVNLVRILNQENVNDYAKPYIRRLPEATMLYDFGLIVPGLLQTPGYARALVLAGQAGDPTRIKQIVEQRMERARRVLDTEQPPWLTAIIYEAVLHCDMGDPDAAREQLEHLLKAQERPNISVRVLPYAAAIVSGSFTLLTLGSNRRAVYTEGFETGNYSEESTSVMKYQRVYDRLAEEALTARQSHGLINDALKRFK